MQLSGVFSKSAVADLGKSELALDDAEGVFYLGANACLELLDSFADSVRFKLGELLSLSRPHCDVPVGGHGESLLYPPVPRIGKDIGFFSVQEVLSLGDVMNIGRGAGKAVHQSRFSIHPNVGLHSKVPLIALLGLVHLRVSCSRGVLGRARRCNDRGIHNRALGQSQSTGHQVAVHRLKDLGGQAVSLEQVAKVENRRFIRNRTLGQGQPRKPAHRGNLVQRFFHGRVTQAVPLLHEVNPDHGAQVIRPSAIARLGIDRLNQTLYLAPGHHPIHLRQKDFTPRLFALDSILRIRKTHLAHVAHPREKNMNIRQSQSEIVAS
jgi:hypothetical protein